MNRNMIFFDIDGTIITEGTHICPKSTENSIKKARENGHLVFINTGRTFFNVTEDIRSIGFDGYVCGCGTYINYNDKELLYKSLEREKCIEIVQKLREYRVNALCEGLNDVFFDNRRPSIGHLARIKAQFGAQGFDVSKSWDDPEISFDKFVVWKEESSDFEKFYSYIIEEFDYIDRGNNFGEVVPKGYSKATGIKFLQEYFDIPLENCYAIGDSTNDLPMLEYVPNSVAMGNSTPILFDSVDFVTKHIEEDGIEHALKHYGII
ncbi:HAD-superfamily hydrolase, subfamily IIB [Clostridium pasteurianum DSM 525 = ATCC 6013]|uniref:Cof-like hydrolase n=1 Tax=Clostridium pasteurianum DSM 525 = ATCC 6013 TaxID=1262449 RepID=A0A0H3JB72_CLOPA|nr:HAD family hydrolase [Clostridium pasteurianum]AJA49225.1 HAD-superfamily hydrolase, subfamily IIB [Clostridium pasteurianum DSM 525 = ATCC 6013]AJA53213.1 HAD-superfamily hydrolase, subfamily IIB [Clostridium pasteurianum DSM 525 = ATCC 6013]AOZ76407.1 hydrolase [Clostridium pasteurianum DSM 525 = ATCC 6013]ELP59158.1 HAD superfamily hydrolase [Clostridium pasteurianum DSM 525 = ATCC 6013]KRU10779.1 Cof-like hydrolase [Clostridium pasteurianum DSM 525 = ATCC 6013]